MLARAFFARRDSTLAPFSCMRLLCICRRKKKKLTGRRADQVHVRECFFPRERGRHRISISLPYAKYQAETNPFIFCAQEKTLRDAFACAPEKKLSLFAYHRGKAIEIIIFYALTRARSEKISTRAEKNLWVTFSERAIHGITVATGLQQCVSEIEFFIVKRVRVPVFSKSADDYEKKIGSRCQMAYNGIIASAHTCQARKDNEQRAKNISKLSFFLYVPE